MTVGQEKTALENSLITSKFPKKYIIQIADKRIGKKYAIGSKTENGGLNIHSNFMSYTEFNCYLIGYYDAKLKKF